MSIQRTVDFDNFFCDNCRIFVYDEVAGLKPRGIKPYTRVDDLPETWMCPVCGADKSNLRAVTLVDGYSSIGKETASLQKHHCKQL
ncbi:MAG TPA: rubredoxin [Drouetiella sp.]|jgi:rubredoxin